MTLWLNVIHVKEADTSSWLDKWVLEWSLVNKLLAGSTFIDSEAYLIGLAQAKGRRLKLAMNVKSVTDTRLLKHQRD